MKTFNIAIMAALASCLNLAIFASPAYGAGQQKVSTLSQGACWVSDNEQSTRVASFNSGISVRLGRPYLSSALKSWQDTVHQELSHEISWKGEAFVHCSGQSTYLVLNLPLKDSSENVCAWFDLAAKRPKLSSWGLSGKKGFCDGFRPGEYVLSLRSGLTGQKLKSYLDSVEWKEEILDLERLADGYWYLKVSPELHFGQQDFEQKLRSSGHFEDVERESLYHPVGDSLKIKNPLKPY